jgi:low affinity Fe/Cu permease
MMDRCMEMMGSMMGSSPWLVVLLAIFVVWLVGLGAVGALIFWGVRRFSSPHV